MDPESKVKLIQDLSIIPFLQGFDLSEFDPALSDVPKSLAVLIDTVA